MISFCTDINIKRNGNTLDKVDTFSFWNFKHLVSKIVYFDTFSDIAQKVGPVLCFSVFYFHAYAIRIDCGKLQKNLKTFSCQKKA